MCIAPMHHLMYPSTALQYPNLTPRGARLWFPFAALRFLSRSVLLSATMAYAQQVLAPLIEPYCVPSQPCYPTAAAFTALNASLAGNLLIPEPLDCSAGEKGRCTNAEWRVQQPGAVMFTNFECVWAFAIIKKRG